MPRRPRIFVEGGIYHVYNRFARGADLFSEPEEAIQFLEILRKARARDGLAVLAWCLMPNHYHLALRTGAVTRWAYRGAEMKQEYGANAVVVEFKPGRGRVLHLLGHFYQEDGNRAGVVAMHRLIVNFLMERFRPGG